MLLICFSFCSFFDNYIYIVKICFFSYMKPVYRASFSVDPEHQLEDIIAVSHDWASQKLKGNIDGFEEGVSCEVEEAKINTIRVDNEYERHFAMRLIHPDNERCGIEWGTEFAVAERENGLKDITVNLENGTTGKLIRPVPTVISRSRLVPMLVDAFSPKAHYPLSTRPIPVTGKTIIKLVRAIQDKNRQLPIVYASASNRTNMPSVNVTGLASQLAGIAHVFADKESSRELTENLGKSMGCWNGALRIYWPFGTDSFDPRIHPYWKEVVLEGMKDDAPFVFFNYIADYTLERESLTSYEKARQVQQEQKIAELREDEDLAQLAELYSNQNDQLREAIEELRKSDRNHISLENSLRHRITILEESITNLKEGIEDPIIPPEFDSVDEAVNKALEMYPKRLKLCGRARSMVKASTYQNTQQVFKALEWLASTYAGVRKGSVRGDLVKSCKEQTGMDYKAHQSKITMGQFEDEYYVKWEGKKRELVEHLRHGSSKSPMETLRIAFFYDPPSNQIVIGYVGQHQRNRKT